MLYDAKRIAALMAQARERSGIAQETLAALLPENAPLECRSSAPK